LAKISVNPGVPQQVKRLAEKHRTPFLVLDRKAVTRTCRLFQESLPDTGIFYAVKANAHRRIIDLLKDLSCGFEISSENELALVLGSGVSPEKIISSNPLKSPAFIQAARQAGVTCFAFDSPEEITKIARFAPGSKVYVRLSVSNEDSQWPLSRKFGVETEVAARLLIEAGGKGLNPWGITFHVGSQCLSQKAWIDAIRKSRLVWRLVEDGGINLRMLNIGGGFPVDHGQPVPSVTEISRVIRESIRKEFPEGIELIAEPGRGLIGEAGILVSSVIAKAKRDGENWLYLDVGVFNGLMESLGGIEYSFQADRKGPRKSWVVAGPSCDSMDTISGRISLPEVKTGDKIYISPAGAYTTAYASRFNGITLPKTYFI